MGEFDTSVMVALLPSITDWCKIELPHLTLVYAGEIPDLNPTAHNEISKDAVSLAMITRRITLQVSGVEVFGDTEKVDALKFYPSPELVGMRRFVERWNASKFPFTPHATIGPQGSAVYPIPKYLTFDRILVSWGKEQLPLWFKP